MRMYEYRSSVTRHYWVHIEVKNNAASVRATFCNAIKIFIALSALTTLHQSVICFLRLSQDPAVVFTNLYKRETIVGARRYAEN